MKKFLCLTVVFMLGQTCFADWNTLETKKEAFDRKSNENYDIYRNNHHQMPLGGYQTKINNSGGIQYGKTNGNLNLNYRNKSQNNQNYWCN